jgi:raffinose/stachyose/melibiose transport system substrate-binding protein
MAIKKWSAGVLAAAVAGAFALSACSPGSLGSSSGSDSGGAVELSYLVDNGGTAEPTAKALADAFHAKNPDISITVETRPSGGEGDNLVKTRLSTGEMTDIFAYNSGSLFQAINPAQNLVPLTDQPWVANTSELFQSVVKSGNDVYGAPGGGTQGGGVLYNTKVYDKLGLKVPTTWSEFMANNAKIKAAGIDPVIQTYQDTWTSQFFVLADFHNIAAKDPKWAEKYTANQAKYANEPALQSFQRMQDVHDAGYFNKDFASTSYNDGLQMLADGKGAQYPMFNSSVAAIAATNPALVADLGFFPLPGDDAATNGVTLWLPGGIYVPKTTEGAKLDAAKKFLAFVASPEGCDVQSKANVPSGPYVVKGCELPSDVPKAIKDLVPYVDKTGPGAATPALEFLSPIKGPALEQITVEVGSGLKSASEGAALYDKDVQKQAQQLNLPGW